MGEAYLGEISIGGFTFAPAGFALCNGATLSIAANTALFSLLGTTYGGNGQSTFQLPNLQGRTPIAFGTSTTGVSYEQGQTGGSETVTLTTTQMPEHIHLISVNTDAGTTYSPGSTTWLAAGPPTGSGPNASSLNLYTANGPNITLAPTSITPTGLSQPFSVLSPFVVVNYVIALQGIYPSRN